MIMLVILAISFVGCSSASKHEGQNSGQAQKEVGTDIGLGICPSGIGASQGDQPKMSLTTKSGNKIILCGYSVESEFDVYSVNSNSVVSKPIVTYRAVQHVKSYSKGDSLVLDELVYHHQNWIPAFRREVSCATQQCEISSEVCIFKRPKATGDLSEIKSYQNGKNKGKFPSERTILLVSDLALAGNKDAQNIFFKGESTLKLDGAVAEAFSATKALLLKLKDAKCL